MKFSCGKTHEFVRVGLTSGEECCENTATLLRHLPTIGARYLGNESMRVQQCQSPGDLGRFGALLFWVLSRPKEHNPYLRVAKALQSPFTPVDGCQQLGVGGFKRIEGSVAALISSHRFADLRCLLGQGSREARGGQSRQVSLIGRPGDRRSSVKV